MTENEIEGSTAPAESLPVDRAFACRACDRRWYYTRCRCPDCGAAEFSTYRLGDGVLVALTEIAVTPDDVRSPNRIAMARFDEDVQVTAQVTGDDVSTGDRVAFDGAHRLRGRSDVDNPRLVSADDP